MLARHGDFRETYRKSSTASRLWLKCPRKQDFMIEIINKKGRLDVTTVTDLIVIHRKTSDGNLRSSAAINRCAGLASPALAPRKF
jgi:hypothetical protein